MKKLKKKNILIDFLYISANAEPQCGPGKLENLVYVGTGFIVIKLNSLVKPNYTTRKSYAKELLDAFLDDKSVVLYTNTCQKEDYGFYQLDVMND